MILSSLPSPLLLVFIIIALAFIFTLKKIYDSICLSTYKGSLLFNSLVSIICVFAVLMLTRFNVKISSYTVIFALSFGIIVFLQQFFFISANKHGDKQTTIAINLLSAIIPAFYGVIVNHDKMDFIKFIGLMSMIACLILGMKSYKQFKNKKLWIVFSVLSCVCSALTGVALIEHPSSGHIGELSMFLTIAFLTASLLFISTFAIVNAKDKQPIFNVNQKEKTELWKTLMLIFIVGGLLLGFTLVLVEFLSGLLSSVALYPSIYVGSFSLFIVLSNIIFKSKFNAKNISALIFGFLTILFVCI